MINPKPWEDFEGYRLQLKVQRLETEKRIRANWHSLRQSAEHSGEILQKIGSLTSGSSKDLIWGPLGKMAMDLIRARLFHPKSK